MQSNNRRPSGNIMMRLAAVLFCLVMFSTYLMGGPSLFMITWMQWISVSRLFKN